MKLREWLISLLVIAFSACDRQEQPQIPECPEGCISINDLTTRQDYWLPFALVNDSNGINLAILNNDTIDFSEGKYIEFNENGFYELILVYDNNPQMPDTFLFTTKTEERENSEWGIRAWVPAPFDPVVLGSGDIEVFYPRMITDSMGVPFIFYVKESGVINPIYAAAECTSTGSKFNIKQGIGSVSIHASELPAQVHFFAGGRSLNITLNKNAGDPVELSGPVSSHTQIPANSLVRIRHNLEITSTGSLTVQEGSIILVDEAVDININGPLIFAGTSDNPVIVTCSNANQYWGGFITRVAGGTIQAEYTIFCRSGYHDSEGYNWGHSGRQALFYTENSTLMLDHCFMLDHIGQIFYPQSATLVLDHILVQRVQTGGQVNHSDLTLRNSVFTDFPDDTDVFLDADNDALYLSGSDAEIENTTFMYTKDDGLDSGATDGGEIILTNCRFEACFHEGAALSSGNSVIKKHTFIRCIFTNCGQGLEIGFSSPNHTVIADQCIFLKNGIGIRYGDNYTWSDISGKMFISNSFSLYNDKDVWNMVRKTWEPKLENLNFENTVISKFCPQYPDLEVIN